MLRKNLGGKKTMRQIIVVAACFILIAIVVIAQNRIFKYQYESNNMAWLEPDEDLEKDIKGYIDDVDWAYYINEVVNEAYNPSVTVKDLYPEEIKR